MVIAKPSVEIVMNGIPVKITIDTGATNTIIDLPMWKKIGCPTLIEKPVIQTVGLSDFNGKQIEIRGEAMIRVCYQGQMAILPALVGVNVSLLPVIGSTVIKFNFNAIFANIPIPRQNRQEPRSGNSINHLPSKSVLNEPAVQNKIQLPLTSARQLINSPRVKVQL